MREILPKNTNIDFFRWFPFTVSLSILLFIGSLYIALGSGKTVLGIDYVGGHEFVVKFDVALDSEQIRNALKEVGFEEAIVQAFEVQSHDYSLRVSSDLEAGVVKSKVQSALEKVAAGKFEIGSTDFVGPTIGSELLTKAIWAVGLGLLVILLYVAVRFEFAFALGAVVALFHDVVITLGIYLLAGHEINGSTLAAALTILGHSVNDTIVVFDRVREEIFRRKEFDLKQLINESINLMLSRTIITTGLTWFTALGLYLFGGGAVADLSFFLVVGIVLGAFSTVYIAGPIVLAWDNYRSQRGRSRKGSVAPVASGGKSDGKPGARAATA